MLELLRGHAQPFGHLQRLAVALRRGERSLDAVAALAQLLAARSSVRDLPRELVGERPLGARGLLELGKVGDARLQSRLLAFAGAQRSP